MRIGPARPSSALAPQSRWYTGDFRFRMKSEVQVLPGPPTIPAGHSAAGAEPGALPGGLGRAGAAPPSPPAPPLALRAPPTRASASATTTHRGRPPSPGTAAT